VRDAVTCWIGAAALFVVAGTPLTGPYALALLTPSEALTRTVLYGAVSVLLVAPAITRRTDGPVRGLLVSRPARAVGRLSYGLFLLHLVVLAAAFDGLGIAPFTGGFWRLLAVVLPISLAVAWASLQLVEEPALRLRARGPGRPARG
jgi:peptidoglycan/LPS O-acetylase OafA/YrhL